MEKDFVRLSKLMSERGMCSRREADKYIEEGSVKVNGVIIDTLGTKISPNSEIELLEEAAIEQDSKVTIILNKPVGLVSSQAEDGYTPAISLLTRRNQDPQFRNHESSSSFSTDKLAVAGRLDINSHGLLIFTQDGRLAKTLIGPDAPVEKEYLIRLNGTVTDEKLELLRHGLILDSAALKPAIVNWENESQLRIILRQGKKRQIRRMCELLELEVIDLKRVRVGNIRLGKLKKGQWRFLSTKEREALFLN